jgi:type II secretory pathway pseudopilin PulG
MNKHQHHQPKVGALRRVSWLRRQPRQRGFLLIMVLLVVSMLSLAALNFSESMLIAHESARLDSQRFQARMMVESGLQMVRLFVALPPVTREEKGGTWDNPQKFQAVNIVPHVDPTFRGNVTIVSPSLDQDGVISGFRYGLQNESAKLNLNALVQIDKMASTLNGVGAALGGAAGATAGAAGGASGGASGGGAGAGGAGGAAAGGAGNQTGGQGQAQGQARGGFGQSGGLAGNSSGGVGASGFGSQFGQLASQATDAPQSFGNKMLMGLPGMTEDVADAILDYLDEDEEPRPYGAEFGDYYQQLLPPYKPANGPIATVEQLLLVRGVTPQLLFGYDQNRNGYIDASEQSQMMTGMPAGSAPGALPMPQGTSGGETGTEPSMPGPLGWAPYLTLHSQEKNASADGTKRININGDDLQLLYDDLLAGGVNDLLASYIVAYRIGGQPPPGAGSPLQSLLAASAATNTQGGMLGAQLSGAGGGGGGGSGGFGSGGFGPSGFGAGGSGQRQQSGGGQGGNQSQGGAQAAPQSGQGGGQNNSQASQGGGQGGQAGGQSGGQGGQGVQGGNQQGSNQQGNTQQGSNQQKQLWTSSVLESLDLSQQKGTVKFNQILDLIDSSVTLGGQAGGQAGGSGQQSAGASGGNQQGQLYASPVSNSPLALADALPTLMDKLTTLETEALPGRINIMECPREILAGMPGMTTELVDSIIEARVDGSQTENRKFETWLAVEGLVTIEQMRGLMPLMTCGGDVFKAQVVGYFEGSASFCRAEAIISGVGASPTMLFFRRLDHLGRGFDVATLGQRTDVGMTPSVVQP